METIRVLIDVKDEAYGKALAKGLMRCDHRFQITTEQGEEAKAEQDLFVRDLPEPFDPKKEEDWKQTAYLSEDAFRENRERHSYYKYGNIRQLSGELILIHAQNLGRTMLVPTGCDVPLIGVLAARGGVGCTGLTRDLAGELAGYFGKRILYLTMEPFSRELPVAGPRHDGIREFMYHHHRGDGRVSGVVEPFLYQSQAGFFAFHAFAGRNPLIEEEPGEMIGFLDHLKHGGFDGILVDLGTGLYPASLAVMAACDRLLLLHPEKEDEGEEPREGEGIFCGEENCRRWLMRKLPEGEDLPLRMVSRREAPALAKDLATLMA